MKSALVAHLSLFVASVGLGCSSASQSPSDDPTDAGSGSDASVGDAAYDSAHDAPGYDAGDAAVIDASGAGDSGDAGSAEAGGDGGDAGAVDVVSARWGDSCAVQGRFAYGDGSLDLPDEDWTSASWEVDSLRHRR